jgi:predicted amidohydrolase
LAIDQMAPRLGDLDQNFAEHREAIRWANKQNAELLVFPELSLTGYSVRSMAPKLAMTARDERLESLAGYAGALGLVIGFIEQGVDGRIYNSAAFLHDGAVRAVQRKLFLPNYGMFDERRFFATGERIVPIDSPWGKLGILICFDMLHPAAAYLHEQAGTRILIGISASPMRGTTADGNMGARDLFRTAQRAHSRLAGLVTVYVNRVGTEEGLTFWGGSLVLDPFAEIVAELPDYDAARSVCDIDLDSIERARLLFPHLKEGRPNFVLQEMWRLRMWQDDFVIPAERLGGPDTDL